MRTAVWEKLSNRLVPQVWGNHLETIKWKSNDYRLREYLSYSLSFQKEQLALYLSEYYLDSIYKNLYRLVGDMYFVDDEDSNKLFTESNQYVLIYSVGDYSNMKYCAGYSLDKINEIFKGRQTPGKTIITIGGKVKDVSSKPIIYSSRAYLS